ncbi:hypothetical protein CAOG_02659 [Capsaspora owczarzaki ATCC 30864]|uniref:hypothetical protein n=1 Tax=Capsaspora owczarzaki (strain ATCC 30864) TaxID=595528 RepID=UPI0003526630|nr:hypothetical protein CAOG_02659 [Capsaspora owczarzaki ATCC 30864]|eukprot:XP_004349409.2 hypothetical protein CAOG_02659 [Capsaspora owczarzaki ATCC 30864]
MAGAANFFRGTTIDQDSRFVNKQNKLLKEIKFPPEFKDKVDMQKVNMEIVKAWIIGRINQILQIDADDVVPNFVIAELEKDRFPDPRKMQLNLTGFLEGNTPDFMLELWKLLLSAQSSPGGVPQQLIEQKKQEILQRKVEMQRLQEAIKAKALATAAKTHTGPVYKSTCFWDVGTFARAPAVTVSPPSFCFPASPSLPIALSQASVSALTFALTLPQASFSSLALTLPLTFPFPEEAPVSSFTFTIALAIASSPQPRSRSRSRSPRRRSHRSRSRSRSPSPRRHSRHSESRHSSSRSHRHRSSRHSRSRSRSPARSRSRSPGHDRKRSSSSRKSESTETAPSTESEPVDATASAAATEETPAAAPMDATE